MSQAEARLSADRALREEARLLETLNRVGRAVSAELDLERVVQVVTDAATELAGAAFGAFFYNVIDGNGERYRLYALSGAPREAFARFPMPQITPVFAPTFSGSGVVRVADILADPRYGQVPPHHGMPKGHLPVRSYLAVPVVSRSGEVLGGLLFGHPEPGMFGERAERVVTGIASQAAIAIDNARSYQAAQLEIAERARVTEALRQSEEALKRLTEGLEVHIAERTAELASANRQLIEQIEQRARVENELRQSQKMESVGQLTGGVAHDFNNLLTIIIGNLQSLKRQLAKPETDRAILQRSADNALRGAQRAAALTQRLLAFSRRQPLDPRPIDANRLVAGMSDLLRRSLGERIGIETVLAGGLWQAHADPNQLEAAILNLAVNARDAMPKGGRLSIETANARLDAPDTGGTGDTGEAGDYVAIAVTDNGVGMSPEIVARAFEPFFTTKEAGHGTGLGLSQVYGFVKQSGGEVKILSAPGRGTTVTLYLPRQTAAVSLAEAPARPQPAPAQPARQSATVLLVEDDDDVRAHAREMLGELGYRVLEAATGPAALELLDRAPEATLLFTDVGLPGGMNGRQLADAARRRHPGLPVLFTTAYAKDAIVHDGRLEAGLELLTKPFTYDSLGAKLRDMLENGSIANAASPCVLLVEDEALVRMVAVEALEECGFRVAEAGDAKEALGRMRAGGIAAAVIDIGLPDKAGDALAAELRALDAGLPIIVASGYSLDTLRAKFTGDARVACLSKPYDPHELETALRGLGVSPMPSSS
jgi:signal transduction histidine kinase/CheY-like chemotaxis protein